jgi:hypothetical protein
LVVVEVVEVVRILKQQIFLLPKIPPMLLLLVQKEQVVLMLMEILEEILLGRRMFVWQMVG